MAAIAMMLAGGNAGLSLPMSSLPDVQVPRVVVEATMAGLPAEQIRSLVTIPLEDGLASAKGLVKIASVSRDGSSLLTLDFQWGQDSAHATGRVREIIDSIYPALPDGAGRPVVTSADSGLEPLVVAVAATSGDLASARRFADQELRSSVRRIDGVGTVTVIGGMLREVAVSVDMRKAAMRGLSVDDVARLFARETADTPAGSLRDRDMELVVVARGRPTSASELARVVAAGPAGPVALSELATVTERNAPRASIFVVDGEEAVGVEVYPSPGSDPVSGARRIREALSDLSERFKGDYTIQIVRDAAAPVAVAIRSLAIAGLIGSGAVALVLLLFLRQLRAGILVAVTIPVSAIAALGAIAVFGRSLNTMSLGGISLAIGMISDNAVVVMDALTTAFGTRNDRPDAASIARVVGTTMMGTLGSTVTTAVVFLPVLFLPGAIGGLFGDLALALLAANAAGWLCANFMVPSLYRVAYRPAIRQTLDTGRRSRCARRNRRLEPEYRRLLRVAMRRPMATLGLAVALAGLGIIIVATRDVSFIPAESSDRLTVVADFPPGTDPDGLALAARRLSSALSGIAGVRACYGSAGAEDGDTRRHADPDFMRESLVLECDVVDDRHHGAAPRSSSAEAILAEAARVVPEGVSLRIAAPVDQSARLLGLDGHASIAARGATHAQAVAAADSATAWLRDACGSWLLDVSVMPGGRRTRVVVRPDRDALAALGLSAAAVSAALRTATAGARVSTIEIAGRDAPVVVFAQGAGYAAGTGDIDEVAQVPIVTHDAVLAVSSLARFDTQGGEATLARLDRADVVYLEPSALPGGKARLDARIESLLRSRPELARADDSAFARYSGAMAGSVVLVVVLLYLTLGAQFESLSLPPVIMATIPLAMAGVGPALALAGLGLDSGSILGLVVLFGVVVNNAILLYETTSARLAAGTRPGPAAYAGASDRVRSIVATTLTTAVALLPIVIMARGASGRSMAVSMLGGIVASAALALFVLPVIFARKRRQ